MDIDFTDMAWDSLYEAVDDELFTDKDARLIYNSIKNKFPVINFGDYLRRYIYQKAEIEEAFPDTDIRLYQEIIRQSFEDNDTPFSFDPTTERNNAIIKRWLSARTVKRRAVFLLGFGLKMSVNDVNNFLTKALRENEINPKDPFEAICYFCYKYDFSYPAFEKIWEEYGKIRPWELDFSEGSEDGTVVLKNSLKSVKTRKELGQYLSHLKVDEKRTKMSVSAYKNFKELYEAGREIIANIYNDEAGDNRWEADKITEGDFENILCSAIPKDGHGNLTPAKKSDLNEQFLGKRLSRQRLSELLSEGIEVDRFDIITLNFFVFSQKLDEYDNIRKRYTAFVEATNAILEECFLGPLYVANPYECFILMCILSDDPLGTYADVWEMSYDK